jgi:hypothetical protein
VPRVGFFCTGEDPANQHIGTLMSEASGREPVLTQAFDAPAIREDCFLDQVEALCAQLRQSARVLP